MVDWQCVRPFSSVEIRGDVFKCLLRGHVVVLLCG